MTIHSHHLFFHRLAMPSTTKRFILTPTTDDAPKIQVIVSTQKDTLQLSYYIEQCDWLNVSYHPTDKLERQDFLWEEHCLECFFDLQGGAGKSYFELNFSPNGAFNLYRFDDYRSPSTLPPMRADGSVTVNKNEHIYQNQITINVYHLGVTLDGIKQMNINNINPTATLYHNGTPIFYASCHASPPDFHNKAFWQTLVQD